MSLLLLFVGATASDAVLFPAMVETGATPFTALRQLRPLTPDRDMTSVTPTRKARRLED